MPSFFLALVFALLAHGGQVRSLSSIAEPRTLARGNPQADSKPGDADNTTVTASPEPPLVEGGNATLVTRISTIFKDLPTIKNVVIAVCGFTAFLIACLMFKIFRSGRRIRKTRKYDIITTPAERVEMAPLNEENDDDEDSTVFDVKYR
ncbi:membrane protein FAM174B isoform X2 [Lissotriton helveticus]